MEAGRRHWLARGRLPACLADGVPQLPRTADDLIEVDIGIESGRIAALEAPAPRPAGQVLRDLDSGMVWPCPLDCHTHLDKGHIWPRKANPDGSFDGALAAVAEDREAHWLAADVRRRFEFGLACHYAHGTAAVRTHLDSIGRQSPISWDMFSQLRADWSGRLTLQAVSLMPVDAFDADEAVAVADLVAGHGGILGAVTFMNEGLERQLETIIRLAEARGLGLDFHVDETLDPASVTLGRIAHAVCRTGFQGPVLVGHCCSLSTQGPDLVDRTLDEVAAAGLAMVGLPLCNLYLQDRQAGRTPRYRGVTLLREAAARGITVAVASDNCRDPFYAYGDHDALEVFREAVRIGHLDHPIAAWPGAVTRAPARIMGLEAAGRVAVGLPADLVLFKARSWSELLSRPQSDRLVLRQGAFIPADLPDYRELDPVVGPPS